MSMHTINAGPVLRAEGIVRNLGEGEARVPVLRGVSLSVQPGELLAVVGPSGCGKTTLLYALGLLDRPDGGEVWIRGEPLGSASDAARTAARSRLVGFVFQFHFLLGEFTAAENLILPMRKRGALAVPEMRRRAHELLDAIGLDGKAGRLASRLSGGEQQRVAIARAMANDPAVLLADEPTGNLDHASSDAVFDLMAGLAKKHRVGVIVVTHNPELARRCDRVLTMCDGRFEKD